MSWHRIRIKVQYHLSRYWLSISFIGKDGFPVEDSVSFYIFDDNGNYLFPIDEDPAITDRTSEWSKRMIFTHAHMLPVYISTCISQTGLRAIDMSTGDELFFIPSLSLFLRRSPGKFSEGFVQKGGPTCIMPI